MSHLLVSPGFRVERGCFWLVKGNFQSQGGGLGYKTEEALRGSSTPHTGGANTQGAVLLVTRQGRTSGWGSVWSPEYVTERAGFKNTCIIVFWAGT